MKHKKVITVWAYDLEKEICETYNLEPFELACVFWEGDFINDSYKSLWIEEDSDETYNGYEWENEHDIYLRNLIRAHLRKTFPNEDRVLVDVSW